MLLNIEEPNLPSEKKEEFAVGIDLGTTNSLVAFSRGDSQEVFEDENGDAMLSSVVAYRDDGKAIVGKEAAGISGAVSSVKRLMGKIDGVGANNLERNPVEVSSEILIVLKKRAEKALGKQIDKAVITVPAYFDDGARAATKEAAKLAGIEVLRLVNEPTAAALAYGLDNATEGIYAIYDLGGGTFDISILKMQKGVFQVLATGGNTELGGDDFDNRIAAYFAEEFLGDIVLEKSEKVELLLLARKAKEFLSNQEIPNPNLLPEREGMKKPPHPLPERKEIREWSGNIGNKKLTLNINKFNQLIESYINITIDIIKAALVDAKVKRADINGVVLVGGSTRVLLVREKVEAFFLQKPLDNVDPDMVVALGAALQAEALTQGSDTLLLDVTPLSLGLETIGGIVEKIIHRNTPIPTSHSQKFTTYEDNQTGMVIKVLQGEREKVEQCRKLAEFELTGIPPMIAGAAVIEVTFTLDADGLLTVTALEETTGIKQKVEVKPSYNLGEKKIAEILIDSIENARSDITERLLIESKVDARRTLKSTKQALKNDRDLLDKVTFTAITKQVALVEKLLGGDDRDAIDYEVQQLDKLSSNFAEKRMNKSMKSFLKGADINEFKELKEEA